ncbi:MAG: rane component of superfamily [Actinomycetota bacterium]
MPSGRPGRVPITTRLTYGWLGLVVATAIVGPWLPIPSWDTVYDDALGVGPFTQGHVLGTDGNGYDLLLGLIDGARLSVFIAVVAVGLGGLIGGALGIAAAYVRGRADTAITMAFNVVLSVPNLVLALALVAVFATNADVTEAVAPWRRIVTLVVSLTIVIIPILGRIARGSALAWTSREFVLAAQTMGMRTRDIVWRHIVPNVMPAMIAVGFLAVGVVIIAEASLSILGVGVPDGASWGSMIARGRNDLDYYPHVVLVPVVVLALTVICTNHVGDLIRARLDRREARI